MAGMEEKEGRVSPLFPTNPRLGRKLFLSINTRVHQVKRTDLQGFKYCDETIHAFDIPDIFLFCERSMLESAKGECNKAAASPGKIDRCIQALGGTDEVATMKFNNMLTVLILPTPFGFANYKKRIYFPLAARSGAWLPLLGCALGLNNGSGVKNGQGEAAAAKEFCTTKLLDRLPEITTGLANAYQRHAQNIANTEHKASSDGSSSSSSSSSPSHSLLEMGSALSLLGVVLSVLRLEPSLPRRLMDEARVGGRQGTEMEHPETKLKEGDEAMKKEDEKVTAAVSEGNEQEELGEGLLTLLFRIMGDSMGRKGGERARLFMMPVKKLLLTLSTCLDVLLQHCTTAAQSSSSSISSSSSSSSSPDSKQQEQIAMKNNNNNKKKKNKKKHQFDEWDLRDAAARMSRKHSPVIVEEKEDGKLKVTTFATLPPACQEALRIMQESCAAASRTSTQEPAAASGAAARTVSTWMCRQVLHLTERMIDGIVTTYLGALSIKAETSMGESDDSEAQRSPHSSQIAQFTASSRFVGNVPRLLFYANMSPSSPSSPSTSLSPPEALSQECLPLSAPSLFKKVLGGWVTAGQCSAMWKEEEEEEKDRSKGDVWPRGVAISLVVLRLLQKLTKRSPLHARTLVKLKSLELLERFVNVSEPYVSRFALKLVKSCFSHAPRAWRSQKYELMTRIYSELRMDLMDTWHVPIEFEGRLSKEQRKDEEAWRDAQLYNLKRHRETAFERVAKRFPVPKIVEEETGHKDVVVVMDVDSYIKMLFETIGK
eukprot:jgi/Bigna1/73273/fgenesh1_pg.23_\